jgi:hypothetical protein
MKRLIITFLAACISIVTHAQKSRIFYRMGVNFARVSISGNSDIDKASMLPSFQVGLMGDIPINKYFAIQPAIIYTGKGAKMESNDVNDVTYYEATAKPMYIEVPVNAVLKIPGRGKNADFFIGMGPYAALGVAGKREIEGRYLGPTYESEERIIYSKEDIAEFEYHEVAGLGVLRRFDYGFNATAGLMGEGVMIAFNYGYGLKKLQSAQDNQIGRNEHRVISVIMGLKL